MQKTNAPVQTTVVFASGAGSSYIRNIPVASQIGITNGAASYTDGFVPLNMTPIASGGVPPYGQDFNGILNALSKAIQWEQAGFFYPFQSSFSTAIGGYPQGTIVLRSDGLGAWLSVADNNTGNPDAAGGATNWLAIRANAGSTSIALAGANVTPDPSTLGVQVLVLTGTLTANVALVLPLRAGSSWIVENNTTGAFTVTVQGATGAGTQVAQGSPAQVFTDGTNYYATTANVAGLYLPINGNAVSASKWANARTISYNGAATGSVSLDGSANVTCSLTLGAGVVALSNMATLNANSLIGNVTGSAATPTAITLTSGIQFSGSALSLGNITPVAVATGGAGQGMSIASTGVVSIDTSTGGQIGLNITCTSGSATIKLIGGGGTTPSKMIRARAGSLEIVNDANTAIIATLTDVGALTCANILTFNGTVQSSQANCILAATGTGAIFLRPNGAGTSTGQATLDTNGNIVTAGGVTANGGVQSNQNFQSSTSTVALAASGSGGIVVLRPNGAGSTTGQAILTSNGNLNISGGLQAVGSGTQGFEIYWNTLAAGQGRNEYINDWGGGSGGHFFYSRSSSAGGATFNGSIDTGGNMVLVGSINIMTSDERVKTNFATREALPSHRLWWGDYDRTDTGDHGISHKAQDVEKTHPHRVHEVDGVFLPDGKTPMKFLDRLGLAEEQGIWCGREIDKLWREIEAMRHAVN